MGNKTLHSRRRLKAGNFVLPSPEEIAGARLTAMTLAGWGVPWPPPHGWRIELERRWREASPIAPMPKLPELAEVVSCANGCGSMTDAVRITRGWTSEGTLSVLTFCSRKCAHEAGFAWAAS